MTDGQKPKFKPDPDLKPFVRQNGGEKPVEETRRKVGRESLRVRFGGPTD